MNSKEQILRTLSEIASRVEQLENSQTVYIGDQIALTRLHTGHKIYVHTRDTGIASHLMLDGRWEPWIETVLVSLVQPGMVVLDVGANFGYYSILMASRLKGNGKLFAFEANPKLTSLLRRSISVNGLEGVVHIVDKAAYDRPAFLNLSFVEEFSGGGTVMEGGSGGHRSKENFRVEAVTVDSVIPEGTAIDVAKIDVEGAEPFVLEGMRRIIDQSPNLKLVIEFWKPAVDRIIPSDKYLESLTTKGFSLRVIEVAGLTNAMTVDQVLNHLGDRLGYIFADRHS